MGQEAKPQPKKIAVKLRAIRRTLNFTQAQMIVCVIPNTIDAAAARAAISEYESGRRAPSLLDAFHYAETVRRLTDCKDFSTDDLIDDARDLPAEISGQTSPVR